MEKWLDEFSPSTLSREEQRKELEWFIEAAKPYKGMKINVVSETIDTHVFESKVLARAFSELTGIELTHDLARGIAENITSPDEWVGFGVGLIFDASEKYQTDKLYEMLAVEEEIHEKTRLGQARSRRDAERWRRWTENGEARDRAVKIPGKVALEDTRPQPAPDAPDVVVLLDQNPMCLITRLNDGTGRFSGGSELVFDDVAAVVMDEFHSFNDYERGIVWELSLGLLPAHVRTLLLSATVGNPEVILEWLQGTSRRAGQVVDPPKVPSKKDLRVL